MPAPQQIDAPRSLLARPLEFCTRCVVRAPRTVLACALLLAVGSVIWTAMHLEFRTSRLALLNPKSSYNRRWLAYLDEFGDDDDAVIVVEGPDAEAVRMAIDDLAAELFERSDLFTDILYKIETPRLQAKGLYYLAPEQLRRTERFIEVVAPLLEDETPQNLLPRLLAANAKGGKQDVAGQQGAAFGDNEQLLASLAVALESGRYQSPLPPAAELQETSNQARASLHAPPEYLLSNGGRLGILLLRITEDDSKFDRSTRSVTELRKVIDSVQYRRERVHIGLTGMPIMENDEMRSSQSDMLRASTLSLGGVAVLFVLGFGGLRHPVMTVAALLIAMAWSFGYVTLGIGHLNILSVSFGVILIGLGVDFGIHYTSRYLQLRLQGEEVESALIATAGSVGPGVVTGGITTSLAFCTAALTAFTGIAELGLIAGGGIVLCLLSALLVLPAMIRLSDGATPAHRTPKPMPVGALAAAAESAPRMVLLLSIAATALLASGLSALRYNHNLLELQPLGLESVTLERRLMESSEHSVWFALSMASSRAELRQLKKQMERLPSVERTEEIGSMLPALAPRQSELARHLALRVASLRGRRVASAGGSIDQLPVLLARALHADPQQEADPRWARIAEALRRMPANRASERLAAWQADFAAELNGRLDRLRETGGIDPPTIDDLPQPLAKRFIGRRGRWLLKIYGRGDIWNMDSLTRFVDDVESVDPRVTGHPVQTFYASRQMQRSYLHAAIYALLAVATVLMLDFRSISITLMAMFPTGLGMLLLFGLLGLLGIPLNPANMIVLPLILGIGIDDGVHVMNDFRQQRGPFRLNKSTAAAVLLTSATTVVGFGSLMLASHQGLRSLGQVLTLGVFCCFLTSIFTLPAILRLWTRRRPETPLLRPIEEGE